MSLPKRNFCAIITTLSYLMKRPALLITTGISTLFLAAAFPVFAETHVSVSNNGEGVHTNVNVENNTGGNTICQNGKCTTTFGSTGSSKVCVNGVCHTGDNGNVNYQSEDGNTKVNINNNTGGSTVNVQQENEAIVTPKRGVPTITPTSFNNVLGARDESGVKKLEAKKKAEEAQAAAEAHKFSLAKFIDNEMASINNFFQSLFGKK
jgi:hypothetical protein